MAESLKLIGICLSQVHMEDRCTFLSALNRFAVARGFRLLVFNTCTPLSESSSPNDDGERSIFQLIPYDALSAMIIFPHFLSNDPVTDEIAARCLAHRLPVITIDKEVPGCVCFTFSYADIFERICAHVIDEHRAKSLLMMAGVKNNLYSEQRVAAFRKVLTERGMYYDDSLIGYGNFWDGSAANVMREWFEEEERPYPDAIICANDSMAIAVSTYLQSHGCRVPQDCIVTGFDCIRQSKYHIPNLTTCRQDYDTMGSRIIQTVEAMLRGEAVSPVQIVGFALIRSQSCGCVPVSYKYYNAAAQDMYECMRRSAQRQEMICSVLSAAAHMQSAEELPAVLSDRFVFPTVLLAVSEDILQEPDYGSHHRGSNAFSENLRFLLRRCFWYQTEACTVPRSELIGQLAPLLTREEPVILCALHFSDLTLGCCIFQPEISADDYEKMHVFMYAMNTAFGAFREQQQLRAANAQLASLRADLNKLGMYDALTGLYNREGFCRAFAQETAGNGAQNMDAFIIAVHPDGLSTVNGTHGYPEGDSAVRAFADAVSACTGEHEFCARIGGNAFAVGGILPAALSDFRAEQFRREFAAALEHYNSTAGKPYRLAADIGFCAVPADTVPDPEALFRAAGTQSAPAAADKNI